MNTSSLLDKFIRSHPNWQDECISQRDDPIGSGSSWDGRELVTFRVLREPPTVQVPPFLVDYWAECSSRVDENADFRHLFHFLSQKWRSMNHGEIQGSITPFASFVTALSQVMEEEPTMEVDRVLRHGQSDPTPIPDDTSSLFGSSPPEHDYPNKRLRPHRSSGSYIPSDPASDQSISDRRIKSEVATNTCINELLRCVTELARKEAEPARRVEWSIVPDTFRVRAGKHIFSSTNDGGLVHREVKSGLWQRASTICYCSVEVLIPEPNSLS